MSVNSLNEELSSVTALNLDLNNEGMAGLTIINVEPIEQDISSFVSSMTITEIEKSIEFLTLDNQIPTSVITANETADAIHNSGPSKNNSQDQNFFNEPDKKPTVIHHHELDGYAVVCRVNEDDLVTNPLVLGFDVTEKKAATNLKNMALNLPGWVRDHLYVVPATLSIGDKKGVRRRGRRGKAVFAMKAVAMALLSAGLGAGLTWATWAQHSDFAVRQLNVEIASLNERLKASTVLATAASEALASSNATLAIAKTENEKLSLRIATLASSSEALNNDNGTPQKIDAQSIPNAGAPPPGNTGQLPKNLTVKQEPPVKNENNGVATKPKKQPNLNKGNYHVVKKPVMKRWKKLDSGRFAQTSPVGETQLPSVSVSAVPTPVVVPAHAPVEEDKPASQNGTVKNYKVIGVTEGRAIVEDATGEKKTVNVGDNFNGKKISSINQATKRLVLE